MTTGLLLSKAFSDRKPADDAEIFAFSVERGQRELLWRASLERAGDLNVREVSLSELVMARDAGDVCHVCGQQVTWVDHLPPLDPGGAVRCFVGIRFLPSAADEVVLGDIFGRVDV